MKLLHGIVAEVLEAIAQQPSPLVALDAQGPLAARTLICSPPGGSDATAYARPFAPAVRALS